MIPNRMYAPGGCEHRRKRVKETAEVLKISPETVMRDWKFAKVWLLGELTA